MNNLPKSYSEAIEVNSDYYFTGKPCRHGHISKRRTKNRTCHSCCVSSSSEWYADNKHKVDRSEYRRDYYLNNLEKHKEYMRFWVKNNKGKNAAKAARRRSSLLQRTPTWLSPSQQEEITDIYNKCPNGFHVDHKVPLQGENVSGLHVPWNLQHLPASENIRKSNKHI